MGSGGGGSPAGNTVASTSTSPWEPQQEPLKFGFKEARNLYESDAPEYYSGQNYISPSNATQLAIGLQGQRALAGDPLTQQAQDVNSATLDGAFLSAGNPYLQNSIDSASRGMSRNFMNSVQPGIDSQFEMAGRYGSNAQATQSDMAQENLAQGLGDISSNMSYQNYSDERGRMENAMGAAQGLDQADYNSISQLGRAGTAQEGYQQTALSADMDKWNFNQTQPYDKLQNYMATVAGGNLGSESVESTPYFNNSGASALGGAMGGASIGSSFGPQGAAIGGVLGGLGGLL